MNSTTKPPTETAALGPLQTEYKVSQVKNRSNQIVGWLFVVVGPLLLLTALILTFTDDTGLNFLCGGVGLLVLLGGVFALWQYRRDSSINVGVYRDGLVYIHGDKTDVVRWDDIDSVKMAVVNVTRSGRQHVYDTVYHYTINPRTGAEVRFSFNKNSIPNIDQLSNTIQHEVTHRQLPKAAETFNRGETLQFGKLNVDRRGIGNSKETIPWSDVEDLKLNNGVITIRKKGKWLNWSNVTVAETPNIFVFMALVNDVLNKQSRPA
jgi:hypothetical protein